MVRQKISKAEMSSLSPTSSTTQSKPSIPTTTFARIVKNLASTQTSTEIKWEGAALEALQTASESYVVELFDRMRFSALVNDRKVIQPRDFASALYRPRQNM